MIHVIFGGLAFSGLRGKVIQIILPRAFLLLLSAFATTVYQTCTSYDFSCNMVFQLKRRSEAGPESGSEVSLRRQARLRSLRPSGTNVPNDANQVDEENELDITATRVKRIG